MINNLCIQVISGRKINNCARGKIIIGDFSETIAIALDWWSVEDYESQWQIGLDRLKVYDKSCLVASINNPCKKRYINWWLLYKKNGKIYIQNQIIVGEIYSGLIGEKLFTPITCYSFIPDYYYEEEVSGWVVSNQNL